MLQQNWHASMRCVVMVGVRVRVRVAVRLLVEATGMGLVCDGLCCSAVSKCVRTRIAALVGPWDCQSW